MRLFTFNKLLFFTLVLALSLDAKMLSRTQFIMGTFVRISLDERDSKHLENSFSIMKAVDLSLSSFNPNANIYKLNLLKTTSLDAYTYDALSLSTKYYQDTNGYFDISIGSITKDLFSFGGDERIPTQKELLSALVDMNGLEFTKSEAHIQDGIKIDLGGMGKGFGVDKVLEYLTEQKVSQGIVGASGDIHCLDTCTIDVQDPFSDGIIASFRTRLKDVSISTSGNYNRYIKSTKNNHLINPKEKSSQDKFISITLVARISNSNLDSYATAVSVMPIKDAYVFLESKNIAYIVLQSSGELIYSYSLFDFIDKLAIKDTDKQ